MKNLLFILAFLFCASSIDAQIFQWGMVPYYKTGPSATNHPTFYESQLCFNMATSEFMKYNRTTKVWESLVTASDVRFAEMSLSNDTSTVSFAATTAAPIDELTAGPLNGFTFLGDTSLQFNGSKAAKFLATYSSTMIFPEAANVITAYPVIGSTPVLRARSRQTNTLATDKIQLNSSAIVTLQPGDKIRLYAVPITHTGTDILSVVEFNLNLVEIR